MKYFNRVTPRDKVVMLNINVNEDMKRFYLYALKCHELEDKIEMGELCDRKTCKNITDKNPVDEFVCSSCGFIIDDFSRVKVDDDGEVFHYEYEIKYCPNCGAKVEDEE